MDTDRLTKSPPGALGDVRSEVGTLRRVLVHRPGRKREERRRRKRKKKKGEKEKKKKQKKRRKR